MSTQVRARMVPLPKEMRAVEVKHFGGPEVLEVTTRPLPEPGLADVLIAVDTAGVGDWDADMRSGWSPDGKDHLPWVLGTDGSGYVAAVGAHIRRFEVGDKVYAYCWNNPKGGFYAEYAAVPAAMVAHAPEALDLKHAGAVPVTGLTALSGIDAVLSIKEGESLIIHGASGGVGTLAVQLAKQRGARVLAIATGKDGVALARKLGADEAVDGHHGKVAEACKRFAPDGAHAVLALAGGEALEQCSKTLRKGGRLAYPHGVEPEPSPREGIEIKAFDATSGAYELDVLSRELAAAKVEVPIAAEYTLDRAKEAHARLASGHVLGKLVLRMTH